MPRLKRPLRYFSPKEAQKIESTLIRVKDLVHDGCDLPEAFAKAAKENSLNRDELHILVRAWNVGSFRDKFESTKGASVEERASDYPVVDYEEVLAYYQQPLSKKASAGQPSVGITVSLDAPFLDTEMPSLPPDNAKDPLAKYASVLTDVEIDQNLKEKKAALERVYNEAKDLIEQLNIRKGYLKAALEDELKSAQDAMKYGEYSINAVVENLSYFDKLASKLAAQQAKTLKPYTKNQWQRKIAFSHSAPPYCHFLKAASILRELNKLEGVLSDLQSLYNQLDDFIKTSFFGLKKKEAELDDIFSKEIKRGAADFSLSDFEELTRKDFEERRELKALLRERIKEWYTTQQAFQERISELDEKIRDKVLNAFTNPKLLNDIAALRGLHFAAKAKLIDPLLSGYDLRRIFNAYMTLRAFAPLAMNYDSVALSFVKKYIEQDDRLDPFDLRQLSAINRAIGHGAVSPEPL